MQCEIQKTQLRLIMTRMTGIGDEFLVYTYNLTSRFRTIAVSGGHRSLKIQHQRPEDHVYISTDLISRLSWQIILIDLFLTAMTCGIFYQQKIAIQTQYSWMNKISKDSVEIPARTELLIERLKSTDNLPSPHKLPLLHNATIHALGQQ